MSPSQAVTAVKKISWKWFLVLVLWGGVAALGPIVIFIMDCLHDYQGDPLNWKIIWHMALYAFGVGAWGYYKKYKAFLEIPPGIEALIQIQKVTTVSTTGKADDPNPVITTKVQETTTTVQTPQPAPVEGPKP